MLTLTLVNENDKNQIRRIYDTEDIPLHLGDYDLYRLICDLEKDGQTASCNDAAIYFLAYLLTSCDVKVKIGFRNS